MEQLTKFAMSKKSRAREIEALNGKISELQQKVETTQGDLNAKKKTLNEVLKQNELLCRELKEHQNLIISLKQQIEDEREFYAKQYTYHRAKLDGIQAQSSSIDIFSPEELASRAEELTKEELSRVLYEDQQEKIFLQNRIKKMENALAASSGTIYNLCVKFLRMKYLRDILQEKLQEESREHHIHVKSLNSLIEDLRTELESSVQKYLKNSEGEFSKNNAMYLQVITKNTRYMYENTMLQHEVRRLQLLIREMASMQEKQFDVCLENSIEKHCNDFQCEVNSIDSSCG
ncbi:uncharacterized protein LOC124154138 [Ischnura elegans]|uniref:uncharacterized protein LOC124154138 n=1 Tax=Ischnura elegans TaxID=197161 RepID=UPI001ED8B1FC|nr:uncharacterized protein LOC124154138 [Ischnura elegans]